MKPGNPILLTILFINLSFAKGQNLVPNPSFEDIIQCPYGPPGPSEIIFAQYWSPPPGSITTADFHHRCVIDTGQLCPSQIPNTFAGYCEPRTGDAVCGFLCFYTQGCGDSREYIQTELTEPLVAGQCYKVEFWLLLAERSGFIVHPIGVAFSVDSLPHNSCSNLIHTPDFNSNTKLDDTGNWMLVSDYFLAQGGEKFITIGNFNTDVNTVIEGTGYSDMDPCWLPTEGAYYFIDDVSVVADTLVNCVNEITLPNTFTPNGDGINDKFEPLTYIGITGANLTIWDRWGEQVFYTEDIEAGWNGIDSENNIRNAGVYFWVLNYTDMKYNNHSITGSVSLIK